jgi:bifunctional non-homologous end joining protein LigD
VRGVPRCRLASPSSSPPPVPGPPTGDGWLFEIKHDGHRLAAISDGSGLRLLSRNGFERSRQFGPVFAGLAEFGREFVMDGELAAPDDRGVTHLDDLTAAISARDESGLAYFAFDLLYLDGHDLRWCALVDRKEALKEVLTAAGCSQLVYVDHVENGGDWLLEAMRKIGAEGIVAKRRAGLYRSGPSRDWLKTKCSEVGEFVITGFRDVAPGKLEAVTVAEMAGSDLREAGEVRFGVGNGLRHLLELIRLEPRPGSRTVPVRPVLAAQVKFFGRHRNGVIRDGVLRSVAPRS